MPEQKPMKLVTFRVSEAVARKVKIVAAMDDISIQDIGAKALADYLTKREEREPIPA